MHRDYTHELRLQARERGRKREGRKRKKEEEMRGGGCLRNVRTNGRCNNINVLIKINGLRDYFIFSKQEQQPNYDDNCINSNSKNNSYDINNNNSKTITIKTNIQAPKEDHQTTLNLKLI